MAKDIDDGHEQYLEYLDSCGKEQCCECKAIAVWVYPGRGSDEMYCDEHVPRDGCSCNYDEVNGVYYKDERGRDLPCVDWMYFEDGVPKE